VNRVAREPSSRCAPLAPAASKIHEPVVDFSSPRRQPDIFCVVVMHYRIADVSESVADE
jgi:hypothetical protein